MHLTLFLVGPPASVRGRMRSAFMEPFANLFVGSLSSKQTQELVEFLESEGCNGVVIAHSRKSPMGVRIKNLGSKGDRAMCNIDGVQLVKRPKKQ